MADTSDVVFGAGREAARVPLDPESEEYRLERARMSRRKLATALLRRAGGPELVAKDGSLVARELREVSDILDGSLVADEFRKVCVTLRLDPLVAEEFREWCDMLGLDPPRPSPPGVCRRDGCDKPLSMTGTVRPTSGSGNANSERGVARRQGFCSNRCMRISHLRGEGGGDG